MSYPFHGTFMAGILHVQEEENTQGTTWYCAVWTKESVPDTSLTPASELTEILVLEPDKWDGHVKL